MKIRNAVVYTFSFNRPDDVDIFLNQCQRLAMQGYNPLFPPTVFDDTVIQQWGKEDDAKISMNDFRIYLGRMLFFKKKWDLRQWAKSYDEFDKWLKNANSTWCTNKSPHRLFREFAAEFYKDAKLEADGHCLK